jgi:hypothetical protein
MLFLVYFLLVAAFPFSHCHAENVLLEKGSCRTEHCRENVFLFADGACCELHEEGHSEADEHHIHFLLDDQPLPRDRGLSQLLERLSCAATDSTPITSANLPYFAASIHAVAVIPAKGFYTAFPGRSPPLI